MKKIYAVAGGFAMKLDAQKGIYVFSYEEQNGDLTLLGNYRPEINAGQGIYDRKRDICYITDERKERPGELGGGGRILCFRLNRETGEPEWVNEKDTFAAAPCYVSMDRSGKYLLIPHHGTRNVVTKTVRRKDGTFGVQTDSDDDTVVLFRIHEDGSIGEMCDVLWNQAEREDGRIVKLPHLHSCVQSPDGEICFLCDKGTDRLHSCRVDRENGKLIPLKSTFVEEGVHPRYGKFHPQLPVFYQNCENHAFLFVWRYEKETGEVLRLQKASLLFDEREAAAWTAEGASDLILDKEAGFLYASLRGLNVLSVFRIKENGALELIQNIPCGGKNPRGLCLSPDERFLFVMNRDSDRIVRFKRKEDGTLSEDGIAAECPLAGNMMFVE